MINILSQLVQTGSKNAVSTEGSQTLSGESNKQGASKKFAGLMMGFLGMNAGSKNQSEAETKLSDVQKEQATIKGEKQVEQHPAQFIGSQFVQLGQLANQSENDAGGNVSKTVEKGGKAGKMNSGQVLKELPTEEKTVVKNSPAAASSGNGKLKNVEVEEQPKAAKELAAAADKIKMAEAQMKNVSVEAKVKSKAVNIESTDKGSGKSGPAQKAAPQPVKDTAIGRSQPTQKNFPGATVLPAKSQQMAADTASAAAPKLQGNLNIPQMPVEAVDGKQMPKTESGNGTLKSSVNGQQSEAKAKQFTSQTRGDQKHPSLKDLAKKVQEKAEAAKGRVPKQAAPESTNDDAKQVSSGKQGFSRAAQSFASSQAEKTLFKPLQQTSSEIKLDPSKLIKVENGGSNGIEMELQAQSDKDASTKDEGKASVKFGSTISHLNKSSGRRDFSAQLVRHLQQQSESGKSGSAKTWSRHRFVLNDGEAVNVAVRQAEGAMQLQLSAGNSELNKVIQQHIDEIRQHLQEQMNVEIDLQLQHFGEQKAGQEGESLQADSQAANGFGTPGQATGSKEQAPLRTARYLGFNKNEWTA